MSRVRERSSLGYTWMTDTIRAGARVGAVLTMFCASLAADVVYVDAGAPGAATGESWADAFPSLQDGLAAAVAGDEVWVVAGVYRPDDGAGVTPGDITASFEVPAGVSVFGGFAGIESSLTQRAQLFDATVLTGDLLGDDDGTLATIGDNAEHVVRIPAGDGARLDGVTVRAGDAPAPGGGGGILVIDGAPLLRQVRVVENKAAAEGAGLYVLGGAARVERCAFAFNRSGDLARTGSGGAVFVVDGTPTFTDCTFDDNRAGGADLARGGAVFLANGDTTFVRCAFTRNLAQHVDQIFGTSYGGALCAYSGAVTLVNCRFADNAAVAVDSAHGGALRVIFASASLVNCVWSSNVSLGTPGYGGAVSLNRGTAEIVGCTFWANRAEASGPFGFAVEVGGVFAETGAVVDLRNSILWGNTEAGARGEGAQVSAGVSIDTSCIEGWTGGLGGVGNFGLDPLFVDPLGIDGTAGTLDDDLTLGAGSPCIDAGNAAALPADVADLDADTDIAEDLPLDAGDAARIAAGAVDMGAYERSPWVTVGGGTQNLAEAPRLYVSGPLTPASTVTLAVGGAPASAAAFVVLGTSVVDAPFKGGLLVPAPTVVVEGLTTSALGTLAASGTWPAGAPSGFDVALQVWSKPTGSAWVGSHGVVGTTP